MGACLVANSAGSQSFIGNGQTLNADAARYWLALVARILRETGIVIVATEGTRNYARQMYLWVNRNKPGFNPAWHPDSPYAYHLSGRAVDVGSGVGYLTTRASAAFYRLAGLYGFRPTVQGEPWHFEWRAEWVGISLETAATVATPIPTKSEEDTMNTVAIVSDTAGNTFVCDFAAKTKWNVFAGLKDSDTALKRAGVLNAMGIPWHKKQPASTFAGLTDITNS
jgi:hypothetical protein